LKHKQTYQNTTVIATPNKHNIHIEDHHRQELCPPETAAKLYENIQCGKDPRKHTTRTATNPGETSILEVSRGHRAAMFRQCDPTAQVRKTSAKQTHRKNTRATAQTTAHTQLQTQIAPTNKETNKQKLKLT